MQDNAPPTNIKVLIERVVEAAQDSREFEKAMADLRAALLRFRDADDVEACLNDVRATRLLAQRRGDALTETSVRELVATLLQPAPDAAEPAGVDDEQLFGARPPVQTRTPVRTDGKPEESTRMYTVWYGTNRRMVTATEPRRGYSSAREESPATVHYGTCDVAIPKSHKFGSLGSSWWKRWLTLSDDRLRLHQIRPEMELDFWRLVTEELKRWDEPERQALVYLHGYSCSFEAAALRAAQIGFDLKAPGLTAFFSWPSKGKTQDYADDEAAVEASERAMHAFLVRFAGEVGAQRVHVIAHSMGNRALLRVVQSVQADAEHTGVKFGQIFLAAPDVDADLFCQLATVYPQLARRTTLYVSPGDMALELSKWLHGAPRAGFTPPVTCVPGIDTVAIPDFDLDLLGHSYYAKAAGVLSDMFELLRHDAPPDERQRLQAAHREDGVPYWTMSP